MECSVGVVHYLSWGFIVCALAYLLKQTREHTPYGRYVDAGGPPGVTFPARLAWVIQEAPCVLVPALLLLTTDTQPGLGRHMLLWTFCLHYVQRTFVYGLLTRGRPTPLHIVVSSIIFCSVNAFLQSHYLLHCVHYQHSWMTYTRLAAGSLVFLVGMAINIHSDHILRRLRKPGEIVYRIPQGGMFEYVSGANFFGEMVEWVGYAIATWSLPTFSFALFTICSIGPRAYHHHRDYHHKFEDYPKARKAVIPFLL